MVLRTKNFNIFGVHWKIQLLRGGSRKTNTEGGECLKRGGLGLSADLEGGGVFERGVETPMHTRYIYDGEYDFLIRIPIKN